ncbi:MAG: zinc-dependent alcohol dehydrogenase [Dissulfurispiraceae bacterium]
MKAVYLTQPGTFEIKEVHTPMPSPGEVLVRIKAALTCGTDLKAFLRGHPLIPMPGLFGHEFSGIIEETGKGVRKLKVGDEVMAVHTAPCLACKFCTKKLYNLCENIMNTKILGAFAEHIVIPQHILRQNVYIKPPHLSFEEAAFLEPLACVVHGLAGLDIKRGDSVLIVGTGPIGLLHLILAKLKGARVTITGLEHQRLQLAQTLGADEIPMPSMLVDGIETATGGLGFDYVFECTGQLEIWENAVNYVRRGGTVILFGGCKQGTVVMYDTYRIHYDEITLKGIFHFTPADVKEAYKLLSSGVINVRPLISGRYPLNNIREPFNRLSRGDGIKFALIP